MKRSILRPDQAAWLAATFDRNRNIYGGFRMEAAGDTGAGADGGDAGDGGEDGGSDGGGDGDKGFPDNTPVDDMTPEQQAAYWRDRAQGHEKRVRGWSRVVKGQTAEQLQASLAELETLRDEKRTDGEKAVEEAKRTAREEAQREFGPKMARLAFETALAHREDRDELIAALNLTSVLTDEGDVDTAKVRSIVEKIAPAGRATDERHDFGAGHRGSRGTKTGLSAGAELYAASRKKTTTGS